MSPRVRRAIVAVSTMMATFLVILDVTIANVALDHMRGTLSAGVDEITWVLTSFLVANAISLPITGWLSDLLGRKRLFILATVAFTLTSAAAGAAPSLAAMVLARFLQGLAGGPLVPLSQATMIETFPARQRGMAMAIWGIGIMFAPIIGPTLGGWITDNWSWRWVFYINVPVGAAAVVLAWLFVPDSTTERPAVRRVYVPGLVLLVVGVSALQFLLNRIDPRWIIVTGCALNAYAMYLMATLSLEASYWHIMLPRFIQGLGIGFTFVPMSTVALSAVPMRELGHASGLFNFIRTIGGSIGIAAVATFLQRGTQTHQARLASHVSLYDPEAWDRYQMLVATFMARGADPATAEQQAWGHLYQTVQRQALLLSFIDNFWWLVWIFAAVIPLVFFLGGRPRAGESPADVQRHAAIVE